MSSEFSENDMEEIISKHPEIIEEGLTLKGRQVYVSGLRIDLLFQDRFGDKLIIELKKGTVSRDHVAQLMEYSGAMPESEKSVTRVMLVANVVPPRWKKALEIHGIEYRELTSRDIVELLKKKEPKMLEEFQKTQTQRVSPPERPRDYAPLKPIGQKLGILWSYNPQAYSMWLTTVAEAIKFQGFIWWDVGWTTKADQFPLPAKGYLCCRGQITHEVLIESIIPQPDKQLAKEVAQNFDKLYKQGIYRPLSYPEENAPLYQYLEGKRSTLTLLKLIELKNKLLELTDIRLWNGEAISRCPQGYNRIIVS